MIHTIKRLIKIKDIDVLIYKLSTVNFKNVNTNFDYKLKISVNRSNIVYSLINNTELVHKSVLFKKVHLLNAISERGEVIGDCYTDIKYRGEGIYPKMLNKIAKEYTKTHSDCNLFIVVDKSNLSSIRGIEKSGFKLYKSLRTKRFLFFYYSKIIKNY